MNKKITIIILLLAITMVVSGCAGKKLNEQKLEPTNNQAQSQGQPSQVVTSTSSENTTNNNSETIDTGDWQTYQNKEYGFELKYPKEYFDFGFGMESATQEEYNDAISSLISLKGTDIHNYIEINRYSREKIKEFYLKDRDINDLELKKNDNGVNYFYVSDFTPELVGEVNLYFIGEKSDKDFICLYIRTEEKKYQQFFDKIISSYKKIRR